jgi:Glycosyltransferase family 87
MPRYYRKAQIALIFLVLPSLLPRIRHFFVTGDLVDFGPYYTAAVLAREHQGISLYSGADTGQDPQNRYAASDTVFAQAARRLGVRPLLYVYPPILADMLIPFSFFPFATAGKIWTAINYALLPLITVLIVRLLKLRLFSWGSLIVLLALFSYRPILLSMAMGQVSVLLLLLSTCGIFFYMKGWHAASGLAFALAAAIKLTPLIVVVPLLVWKEWEVLRAFVLSLLLFAFVICLENGPSTLVDYFLHVMPAMSRGNMAIGNSSLSASLERVYAALHHKTIYPDMTAYVPKGIILLGKVCALAILGAAGFLTYKNRRGTGIEDRVMTLALFTMLSVWISPVSWLHGYSLCFLALSLLWVKSVREGIPDWSLAGMFVCTFLFTTYFIRFCITLAGKSWYPVLDSVLLSLTPLAGVLLVLGELAARRSAKTPRQTAVPNSMDRLPISSM